MNSSQRKHTHTNTRLYNPSLHAPPRVAGLCFSLCKITVVQVSSGQCDADRQARKRTAKHLCSPQRSFLSYNWLSCPACGFGYKTRSSSRSRLHLPEEHRGQWKVLSKMSGKVASSFKGPWMYMAHGFQCLLWDSAAPGEARQEERTRDQRKEMSRKKEQREAA